MTARPLDTSKLVPMIDALKHGAVGSIKAALVAVGIRPGYVGPCRDDYGYAVHFGRLRFFLSLLAKVELFIESPAAIEVKVADLDGAARAIAEAVRDQHRETSRAVEEECSCGKAHHALLALALLAERHPGMHPAIALAFRDADSHGDARAATPEVVASATARLQRAINDMTWQTGAAISEDEE